ncbi:MAG: S24 family peptidase [Trichloromonadaceae bacterium]
MDSLSLMNQAASALVWPSHIQIVRVDGDTMAPTFKAGDFLAVDTTQREIREGVYVLKSRDTLVVRRLQIPPHVPGHVLVGCDNRRYGTPNNYPRAKVEPEILGRVVLVESQVL